MSSARHVPLPVPVTLAAAVVCYALFWPIAMDDLGNDYVPWLMHIVDAGPLRAFATPFASYNPPYLYLLALVSPLYGTVSALTLIKGVSLLGTAALVIATARLLQTLQVAHAWRWAAFVLLLPTTLLNTALLGQCDALYAAPCIAALDAAVARRHRMMLLWCGVAIAFKIQAVLFAPFIIALLINRRVALWQWLIVPGVFFASLVPAWALGWPIDALLSIYYQQTGYSPLLSLNAPNIWFVVQTIFPRDAPVFAGLALALAVGVTGFYITRFSASLPQGARLLPVAVLAVLITAGLLPHMHERYFFVGEIAAFAWAVSSADRRAWTIALLIQAGGAAAVLAYALDHASILVLLGFAAIAAATYRLAAPLLKPAANDNPLMIRTA